MCDPGTILSMAGAGASAYGRMQQGAMEADNNLAKSKFSLLQADLYGDSANAAEGNLDLLRTQAEIARGNVAITEAKGRLNESRVRAQGDKVLAGQSLSFSYRNIDPAYGSPLVMQGKAAADIETDIGLVRAGTAIERAAALTGVANIQSSALSQANAAVTARGNAVLSTANAGMAAKNASAAEDAAVWGAATTLLTTGGKIWNDWSSKAATAAAGA